MSETYIPNARDAVVAYFGRNARGNLRCYCVRCNDESPLTNASKIYGDLYVALGDRDRAYDEDRCDVCGVTLLQLSQMCQAEHDEQQARWARGPITDLVEYGVRTSPRCRIY